MVQHANMILSLFPPLMFDLPLQAALPPGAVQGCAPPGSPYRAARHPAPLPAHIGRRPLRVSRVRHN